MTLLSRPNLALLKIALAGLALAGGLAVAGMVRGGGGAPDADATQAGAATAGGAGAKEEPVNDDWAPGQKIVKTDAEWRRLLTPEQYRVTRERGTERPFTGQYCERHEPGLYRCVGCQLILFDARTKFASGSGWPSYFQPISADRLSLIADRSLGMERTEVRCARCDAHLGHVFADGPPPTGLRYCINSVALEFTPTATPTAPPAAR